MIGQTLSHFKITAKLGEGGMGDVYRATDGRLGREVAILEQDADKRFLVLELIDGDTVQALFQKGLPLESALDIASQVANALEAAHEQRVVHHDLKPANIIVTPGGTVEVLDFGLAKAWAPDAGDPHISASPTLPAQMTQAGMILGTAAYMSPEQARGREVDKRADIWSFGVLTFEMLTGQELFGGDTVTNTLAAVVRADPDWKSLPRRTPRRVRETGVDEEGPALFLRDLGSLEAKRYSSTGGAEQPFFSRDGEWIGFYANGSLRKVSVRGGAPLTLAEGTRRSRGASWGTDGYVYYAPHTTDGIWRVPDGGGEPEQITVPLEAERSHRFPKVLPSGDKFLMTVQLSGQTFDGAHIEIVDIATGERKEVFRGGTHGRYLASGHLIFVREGTLYAAPFDASSGEVLRQPAPVLEGVRYSAGRGGARVTVSLDGTLIYTPGTAQDERGVELTRLTLDGQQSALSKTADNYRNTVYSPDGTRLAYSLYNESNSADIWIHDLERDVRTRLTFDDQTDFFPQWTPDGTALVFSSSRTSGDPGDLWMKRADGTSDAELLHQAPAFQGPQTWLEGGRVLMFATAEEGSLDPRLLDLETREVQTYLATEFSEVRGQASSDGRWGGDGRDPAGSRLQLVRGAEPVGAAPKVVEPRLDRRMPMTRIKKHANKRAKPNCQKTDVQREQPFWVIDPVVQGWKTARFVEAYFHHSELQRQWAWEAMELVGLHPNQQILDFGCGDGKITACLSRLVGEGRVVGFDASPTMIGFCRTKFPAAYYPRLDYVSEGLEGFARGRREAFDLVTSFCVFHLVPEPRVVLEHLRSVLRKEGTLLLVTPVGDDNPVLFETAEECFKSFGLPCPWEAGKLFRSQNSMVSVDGCRTILEKAGFRVDHLAKATHPTVFVNERELINWMVGTLSANWQVSYEMSQEFFSKLVNDMVARDPAMKLPDGALAFKYARLNVVAR